QDCAAESSLPCIFFDRDCCEPASPATSRCARCHTPTPCQRSCILLPPRAEARPLTPSRWNRTIPPCPTFHNQFRSPSSRCVRICGSSLQISFPPAWDRSLGEP